MLIFLSWKWEDHFKILDLCKKIVINAQLHEGTSIKFDKCFTFVTDKGCLTYNQFVRVQELNSTRTHELMFSHISKKDLSLEDSLIVYFSEVLLQMVVILWFIHLTNSHMSMWSDSNMSNNSIYSPINARGRRYC